jgi:hypothetical protein
MVAAWHMWKWTGASRWRDLFVENVEQLFRTWQPSEHAPCHLWTQDLYGRIVQLLGAGHGFAGNVDPLLRGAELLSPAQRTMLFERCYERCRRPAMEAGDVVNWDPGVGPPRPGRTTPLVQWCHGAPGIVTGLAHYPATRSAAWTISCAAPATWCGTPVRSPRDTACATVPPATAMRSWRCTSAPAIPCGSSALAPLRCMRSASRNACARSMARAAIRLWTGDPGLAVYLWHCIEGRGSFPCLDVLE